MGGSATNGALFNTQQGSVTWSGFLGGRQFPASRTIAFAVTVNPGIADDTQITNVATGTLFLPNQSLLQPQVALPINVDCPPPPITFTLNKNRAFSRPLCPGSNIAYSIRLDNTSQRGNLLDYSIEDAIPPSTTFAGGITGGGVFDSAMDKITWTESLGPGETRFFGFSVTVDTVPDQTLIRNRATATLSDPQIGDSKTGEVEVQDGVDCPRPTGSLTWTGAENSDLCNPNNFEPAFEPGPDDDVIIPANSPLAILSQSKQLRSVTVGVGSILRIEGGSLSLSTASRVDGLLVIGSGEASAGASAVQGGVSGSLTIQGDVSGTGKITNFAQLILSSVNLNVELETEGTVAVNGLVNLTRRSENRGNYSLDDGDSLHYQGDGHDLAMTLNGPANSASDAVVFLQQATTATVQVDASSSADVTGPVEVRGHLTVIIAGAPPVNGMSSPQTGSSESGTVTWSGGNIDFGGGSSLKNEGAMTLNDPGDGSPAMTVENDAEFSNAGTVTWNGGTIRLEGNAQLVNEASGEFSGSGTIEGSVLNAGLFQVGNSIDSITVTGKYTQLGTGELRMELAGASSFDTLLVGTAAMESASLGGTLSVSLIDAFTPAAGNSFLIVDGPTEGSFSNCTPSEATCTGFPALAPGLIWEVTQGSVTLSVLQPGADLELKKVADKTLADVGDTATFTVTLENKGPLTATNIQVSDPVPSGLTDVVSSGGYDQGTGIWTVPSLAKDATTTLTLTGELSSSGTITNTAELIAVDQIDPDSTPNNGDESEDDHVSVSVSVDKVADLDISKIDDPDPVNPGNNLTYTLSATNKGPSQATSVTVIDTLPSGITFVEAAGAGWSCSEVAKTVTCTRGSLDAAETSPDITISVAVDFSTNGELENTATVSASEKDNKQEDNSQTIGTTVAVSPLYFAQFGDGEVASAGLVQPSGAGTLQLSSEFFLLNPGKGMEAAATILIKGDDGQPLTNVDLNGATLPQGAVDVTVPACGMRILRTDGQGPLQAGSASVTSDKQLSGVVVFSSGIGAAGVGASTALPAFVAPMIKKAEISTGIAFQNPGMDPVMVNLELRNSDGDLLATAVITLDGMGHQALFVDEIAWTPEPGVTLDFADFEGLVKATTSAGGVAATVIQTRPQEFVTMPVSAPTETGNLELLFAQFGDGEQSGVSVSSEIILLNLSKTMSAQATIVLKGDDGIPLSGADLEGQVLVGGTRDVTIPACGMRILRTDGEGPLQVGSATVTSDRPLAGVIVFDSSAGAAGVGSSRRLPGFAAPMIKNATTSTGIAVQNPGNDPVTIDLQLRSPEGALLATASIVLPGMGHRALFVDEIDWTPEAGITLDLSDFEGLLKGTSSEGPVAATVIQTRGEILFVTMPVTLSN